MDYKPQKGSIAFNEAGCLGLIIQDAPRADEQDTRISYYVGVHLTDKTAAMGSAWSSSKPRVCGRLILIPGTLTYTVEAQGNGRVFLFN